MLELNFKRAIYWLDYIDGKINIAKYTPAVSFILKSDTSLNVLKDHGIIEEHDGKYYLMYYMYNLRIAEIIGTIHHIPNSIELPYTKYPNFSNIYRFRKPDLYEYIIYLEDYDRWIPFKLKEIIKFIRCRDKCRRNKCKKEKHNNAS